MKLIAVLLIFLAMEQPIGAMHMSSVQSQSQQGQAEGDEAKPAFTSILHQLQMLQLNQATTPSPSPTRLPSPSPESEPLLTFVLTDIATAVLVISAIILLSVDLLKFLFTIVLVVVQYKRSAKKSNEVRKSLRQSGMKKIFYELLPLIWTTVATIVIIFSHVTSAGRLIQSNHAAFVVAMVFLAIRAVWFVFAVLLYRNLMFADSGLVGFGEGVAITAQAMLVGHKSSNVVETKTSIVDVLTRINSAFTILSILFSVLTFAALITVGARACKVPEISRTSDKLVVDGSCTYGSYLPNGASCRLYCIGARFDGTQPSCSNGIFNQGSFNCLAV